MKAGIPLSVPITCRPGGRLRARNIPSFSSATTAPSQEMVSQDRELAGLFVDIDSGGVLRGEDRSRSNCENDLQCPGDRYVWPGYQLTLIRQRVSGQQ